MFYKDRGFRHEFFAALNRCVATPFFSMPRLAGKNENHRPAPETVTRLPRNLARERYLAIPTFIRQGKTLTL